MSDMRTRPDIQQRAALARLSVPREQKVLHIRSMQQRDERAHNTVQYRKNLLLEQMMASFDRWMRSIL